MKIGKSEHWTARAERVSDGDWRILGENDHGDLLVPGNILRGTPAGQAGLVVVYGWHDIYNPWKPAHWRYWLRSRLTMRIAFLQAT